MRVFQITHRLVIVTVFYFYFFCSPKRNETKKKAPPKQPSLPALLHPAHIPDWATLFVDVSRTRNQWLMDFYLNVVVNELTEIFSVDLCRLNTHTLLARHSFWLTRLSVHVPRPGNFNDCINFGD
jgi:hypothetical protein